MTNVQIGLPVTGLFFLHLLNSRLETFGGRFMNYVFPKAALNIFYLIVGA